MVFLSKQHLKIQEYQRSVQNASLLANTSNNREYRWSKKKQLLDDLLETTRDYSEFVVPEDLLYVAIHIINDEPFLSNTETTSKPLQMSSRIDPADVKDINDSNLMNEFTNSIADMIQQFFLFSFSGI